MTNRLEVHRVGIARDGDMVGHTSASSEPLRFVMQPDYIVQGVRAAHRYAHHAERARRWPLYAGVEAIGMNEAQYEITKAHWQYEQDLPRHILEEIAFS